MSGLNIVRIISMTIELLHDRALKEPDEQLRKWAMICDRSRTNEQLKT